MLQSLPKHTRLKQAMIHDIDQVTAEQCKRSLFFFMRTFWHEVSASKPAWNWHIPYLCGQLMKIAYRVANNLPREYDLIINVPPGTTKSMTCSIMFPIWCWINWPWMRFITASYSSPLSLELAEYSRDLMRSNTFKRLFPRLVLKRDKDTKSNFRIQEKIYSPDGEFVGYKSGGNRYTTSVGGTLTGFHGHILLIDDPIDPTGAGRGNELHTTNRWMDQTLSTRKIDKEVSTTILIMQRIHQEDPAGHQLENPEKRISHICLPGEMRNFRDKVHPTELIEFYQDDLLDPKRMPWSVLQDMEADLGQYGYAGQVGQNPTPVGGGMFQVDNFQYIDQFPDAKDDPGNKVSQIVRYWDKASTADGGAFTAGVKIAKLQSNKFVVMDVKRGQWATNDREKRIRATAEADGTGVIVFQEQEGGSGGKDSALAGISNLAGYACYADRPTGDKVVRADPYSVQVNNGNVLLIRADWNFHFIDEHRHFPFGKYKDQVDAAAGAFNKLRSVKNANVWSLNFA